MQNKSNKFILLGALAGVILGIALRFLPPSPHIIFILGLLGGLFINMLKMVLVPLIFLSIVLGIAQLRTGNEMKKIWPLTMAYFVCSLIVSVIIGLTAANLLHPGQGLNIAMFHANTHAYSAGAYSTKNFITSLTAGIFVNPFRAAAENNILPIVIFALLLGIAFVADKTRHQRILDLFGEGLGLITMILGWIMYFAPIGVMALLAKLIATQDAQLLPILSGYIFAVTAATLTHGLIILPVVLWAITGISPWRFFSAMKDALITALSTSSSSATMPVTMRCLTENLQMPKSVTNFVIPLGTTVNMDGTALYEALAALFVANLCGLHLGLFQQIIVAFTAMLASIGAPGIPSAGMVTMIMVLQSVGLPIEALAILIPIDRPLDTIRTMVNVEGDSVGTCIVAKLSKA